MQTAPEVFVHELKDMFDAENQLVEALGKQAEESDRPDLKRAFESHRAQTQKQVQRLEQVFESIGEESEEAECAGIRGLIQEHDNFKEGAPQRTCLTYLMSKRRPRSSLMKSARTSRWSAWPGLWGIARQCSC